MDYFDFSSAMKVLMAYMNQRQYENQVNLMRLFFQECIDELEITLVESTISRWLGRERWLDEGIVKYYADSRHQVLLCRGIEKRVLNLMNDPMMAAWTLKKTLQNSKYISDAKRLEIIEDTIFETDGEIADFIGSLLCFAMAQPPWVQVQNLLWKVENQELQVRDMLYDADVPSPCCWFQGRGKEIKKLHTYLQKKRHVFLHGIPGIGKSEMAKKYAQVYEEEYAKIFYITYDEDLRQTIMGLSFAYDVPNEDPRVRFKRHNHFLKGLPESVLLIIDNVNNVEDVDLDMVLDYSCRVLVTTRNRWQHKNNIELKELDKKSILQMVQYFFSGYEEHQKTVKKIIRTVHGHTFVVELAARLLETGILDPESLLEKLRTERVDMDLSDEIRIHKDGKRKKATYHDHIRMLFRMFDLTGQMQTVMRNMALMPVLGIPVRLFAQWLSLDNLNAVNALLEMGLLQMLPKQQIALHPLIREVSESEFHPSIRSCMGLMETLYRICMARGLEITYHQCLFQTIESIMVYAEVDDVPIYFLFLEGAFWCMEKYRHDSGMKKIIVAMGELLKDPLIRSNRNRAVLLQCQCALEDDRDAALKKLQKAVSLLQSLNEDTAPLLANLQSNIGRCYLEDKLYEKARIHMEQGARILETFGMQETEDAMIQYINYANVLVYQGEAQRGYNILKWLRTYLEKENRTLCDDYAAVLYQMGSLLNFSAHYDHAKDCLCRALTVYERIFHDAPEVLLEKKCLIDKILLEIDRREEEFPLN